MRKCILVFLLCSLTSFFAHAQKIFSAGITGGVARHSARIADIDKEAHLDYYAGFTCNVKLPVGFSIQPAVVFTRQSAYFTENTIFKTNSIEVPVSFQWGPDLLLFRPFVEVTPFVGFDLYSEGEILVDNVVVSDPAYRKELLRGEYGVGVGGGIDIWKFRVTARYTLNLDKIPRDGVRFDLLEHIGDNFSGWSLGLSMFF